MFSGVSKGNTEEKWINQATQVVSLDEWTCDSLCYEDMKEIF